jgi:hypothetical protein
MVFLFLFLFYLFLWRIFATRRPKKKMGWRIQQMAFEGIFYKKIAISKEKKLKSRQI